MNNVLVAWTNSHVLLIGRIRYPGHEDFFVHISPESGTNVVREKAQLHIGIKADSKA